MTQLPPSGAVRALLDEDLAELYEDAPAGYVSTYPDGTIVRANRTFCRWSGFETAELAQRRFQDLFSIPGRIYYETHLGPLLAMQGSLNEIALDLVCKEGATLPVLVNALQKRAPNGEPLLNRFTLFNATDRRRYERQLLEARRQAEAALRAKAELLAMLSHDIRTPLSSIMAVAALLERGASDGQRADAVRILKSSARSMLHLVEEILEHGRIEAGVLTVHARPFDLGALARELAENLQPLARGKALELRCEIDARIPARLAGDATKVGQILGNLLGNALKFTERGSVVLHAELLEERPDGPVVRLRVVDTGIGIAEDALPRIFEEYGQADEAIGRRYGGSGLGLAISRRLAQALGSDLQVRSRPGQGSEFRFDLALALAPG